MRLRALEGCLLITQAGRPEDHVLEAGDELQLSGGGLVVVWALAPSRLKVGPAGPGLLDSERGALGRRGSRGGVMPAT